MHEDLLRIGAVPFEVVIEQSLYPFRPVSKDVWSLTNNKVTPLRLLIVGVRVEEQLHSFLAFIVVVVGVEKVLHLASLGGVAGLSVVL